MQIDYTRPALNLHDTKTHFFRLRQTPSFDDVNVMDKRPQVNNYFF